VGVYLGKVRKWVQLCREARSWDTAVGATPTGSVVLPLPERGT